MKRRLLAMLIAVVMVLSIIPATAFAAEEKPDNGTPYFAMSNMTLGGVLHVNFKVDANGANINDYYVVVETLAADDSVEKTQEIREPVQSYVALENDGIEDDLVYVYRAELIAHRMLKPLRAKLMKKDQEKPVDTETWTLAGYIQKLQEQFPVSNAENSKLHEMMNAMYYYGQYVEYYAHHNEGVAEPHVDEVENVKANALEDYKFLFAKTPTWKVSANLFLDDAVDVVITFKTAIPLVVSVNGKHVDVEEDEKGNQFITIPEIMPQEWSKIYTITACTVENGEEVMQMSLEYGVYSYIYTKLDKPSAATGLTGLVQSMYLFGQAVTRYASDTGLHHIVSTPNASRVMYENGEKQYRFIFEYENNTDYNAAQKRAVDYINSVFAQIGCDKMDYTQRSAVKTWSEGNKWIILGDKELFEKAGLKMPQAALGLTGYYIATKGNSVFIMVDEHADEHQAYQLAAMELLRNILGYIQYSDDCIGYDVDPAGTITIPDMDIVEKPDMDFRLESAYQAIQDAYGMGYTVNNMFIPVKENEADYGNDAVAGETYHTALTLLDPDVYWDGYQNVMTGEYVPQGTGNWFYKTDVDSGFFSQYPLYQLCYSKIANDVEYDGKNAYEIIYQNMKTAILKADSSLYNIVFGIADNSNICNCSTCQSYNGGATVAYWDVINRLAVDFAQDEEIHNYNHNPIRVVGMAYRAYAQIPEVKDGDLHLDANTAVLVAPIDASCNTPLQNQTTGTYNYPAILEAWAAEANHMYMWLYQANFDNYMYPMDSWVVMQQNLLYARSLGVELLFYQGQSDAKNATGFVKLKEYLETEWTYQADQPAADLVPEFFKHYFGPAGLTGKTEEENGPMIKYYLALSEHMKTLSTKGYTGQYKAEINKSGYWPQDKLKEFMGYINAAYEAVLASGCANADDYIERIRLESMFPRFALLELYQDETYGTYEAFLADCERLNLNMHHEHTDWATWIASDKCTNKSAWSATCSHTYTDTAAAKYLYANATVEHGTLYYQSCSKCGAVGTETFDQGNAIATEIINDETIIENGVMSVPNMTAGNVTVTLGGGTYTGTVAGGTLTITGLPIANGKQTESVIIVQGNSTYTYTNIWHVTQVIDNVAELKALSDASMDANTRETTLPGYYILGNDIDCGNTSVFEGGGSWNDGGFTGTFDGRGHKISNVVAANQGGMFGRMRPGAVLKDVHFENVAFNTNVSLIAKISENATFTNVTVDIASWSSNPGNMTYAGVLGVTKNAGNTFNNFIINVAPGVSVSCLMGAQFSGTGNITVNLPNNAQIVNYYTDASGNSVTSAEGTIITVNTIEYNNYTVDTAYTGECVGTLTLTNEGFTDGAIASVSVNGSAAQTVTVSGNSVTFGLSNAAAGQDNAVVVAIGTNTWTYTKVFCVTQIIDTADEMKAFIALSTGADYSGYYRLGANINMNGAEVGAVECWDTGFTGTFDGCGYTVSNFKVNTRGGIFGGLKGATVKNVTFDNVGYLYATATYGSALLGRTGIGNTTISNVTVNITSWHNGGNVNGGALFASKTENVTFTSVAVTVANNLSITTQFFGNGFNVGNVTGDITVTLSAGASIEYWYKDSANVQIKDEASLCAVFTVIKSYEPVEETYNDFIVAEGTASVTIENELITLGTATVQVDDNTAQEVTVTEAGKISVGLNSMGQHKVIITTPNGDTLTYTEVWYVTKVLRTAADLAVLNVGNSSNVRNGYYILNGDIDCGGANIGGASTVNANNHNLWGNGFSGTFNGRGYAIKNATTTDYGIFGSIDGTIKNVDFEQITFALHASLFARTIGVSIRATFENVNIEIVGWNSASTDGSIFGRSKTNQVTYTDVTVTVADGLTITKFFGGTDNAAQNNGNLTVNLGVGSSVALWFADATKPNFVTVNESGRAPVTEALDTLVAGENTTAVIFTHDGFADCTSANVTINGHTENNVSISNGRLSVDLTTYGVSAMGQVTSGAVIATDYGDTLTYTEVWYVTQVINTGDEMKAFSSEINKSTTANTAGYYILGNDITCTQTNQTTWAPAWSIGFSGTFDGRGCKISDINVGSSGGLFGNLIGATVKNVVFDNVKFTTTDGALLGRRSQANSGTNVTLENLTVNITSWDATGEAGVFTCREAMNTNHNNLVINVADGVVIHNLLGRCWNTNYGSGITLNLASSASITAYYWTGTADTTAVTTKPSIIK